jgi:hypothetical protein
MFDGPKRTAVMIAAVLIAVLLRGAVADAVSEWWRERRRRRNWVIYMGGRQ